MLPIIANVCMCKHGYKHEYEHDNKLEMIILLTFTLMIHVFAADIPTPFLGAREPCLGACLGTQRTVCRSESGFRIRISDMVLTPDFESGFGIRIWDPDLGSGFGL